MTEEESEGGVSGGRRTGRQVTRDLQKKELEKLMAHPVRKRTVPYCSSTDL